MKKKMLLMTNVCFIVAAAVLFTSFSAAAKENMNYLAIKGGGFSPSGDFDDKEFDSGFIGEMAIGRYFEMDTAIEVGIGYYHSEAERIGLGLNERQFIDLDVVPVIGTLKGILPFDEVELYGGAGFGFYFAQSKVDVRINNTSESFSDDDVVIGVHLLIGGNVHLSPTVFLGFEGRSVWTEDTEFSGNVSGVPQKVTSDLNASSVTVNLGFRF